MFIDWVTSGQTEKYLALGQDVRYARSVRLDLEPNIFPSCPPTQSINTHYYMASSANGQDDSNRALWLATRAGKMEPSCPLGTTRCIPQAKLPRKPYNKSLIDQVCSVKMAGYWPRSFFIDLTSQESSATTRWTILTFLVTSYSPSPFNFPAPNKRPFSSISPAILTNDNGDAQFVIGASGGKRITTTVSLVCLMASYFEHEQMKGRKVHPPYRSYSEVYYFLVIFRSRYKNKWSKHKWDCFFHLLWHHPYKTRANSYL